MLASALTTYLLYLMVAVPFAVWSGRVAYSSTIARISATGGAGRPSRAAVLWLVVLPACLIGTFLLRGFDRSGAAGEWDEWGQVYFLVMSPCLGLIAGFALGVLIARRKGHAG